VLLFLAGVEITKVRRRVGRARVVVYPEKRFGSTRVAQVRQSAQIRCTLALKGDCSRVKVWACALAVARSAVRKAMVAVSAVFRSRRCGVGFGSKNRNAGFMV